MRDKDSTSVVNSARPGAPGRKILRSQQLYLFLLNQKNKKIKKKKRKKKKIFVQNNVGWDESYVEQEANSKGGSDSHVLCLSKQDLKYQRNEVGSDFKPKDRK